MTQFNEKLNQKVGRLSTTERNRLQTQYLQLITDPEIKSTQDICDALGVSHDTIQRWEANRSFKLKKTAYLRERHVTEQDLRNLEVYNSVHKQATDSKKPVIFAAKIHLERHDPRYLARDLRNLAVNIFDLRGTLDKLNIQAGLEHINRALTALSITTEPKMLIDAQAEVENAKTP